MTDAFDGTGFEVTFSQPVNSAGFLYSCIGCDLEPFQSEIHWRLSDGNGEFLLEPSVVVDMTGGVRFVGISAALCGAGMVQARAG